MWMLKDIGVDWRDRNLIAKLYLGQRALLSELMENYLATASSDKESSPLFPLLFNLYIQYVINERSTGGSQVAQYRYTVLKPIGKVNGEAQILTPCKIYTP